MIRRLVLATLVAAVALPGVASAQYREAQPRETQPRETQRREMPAREMPSSERIQRQLEAQPRMQVAPQRRVTVQEFKRRPDLRRAAPSIEIQSINFATGSAEIPYSQYEKVSEIARALNRRAERNPRARFLIEGHTDAVGSDYSNQLLSERRADSLRRVLVREFGVPQRTLETVGYGEEYLLVQTQNENWQNRRVTLRRVDQFLR